MRSSSRPRRRLSVTSCCRKSSDAPANSDACRRGVTAASTRSTRPITRMSRKKTRSPALVTDPAGSGPPRCRAYASQSRGARSGRAGSVCAARTTFPVVSKSTIGMSRIVATRSTSSPTSFCCTTSSSSWICRAAVRRSVCMSPAADPPASSSWSCSPSAASSSAVWRRTWSCSMIVVWNSPKSEPWTLVLSSTRSMSASTTLLRRTISASSAARFAGRSSRPGPVISGPPRRPARPSRRRSPSASG